MNFLTKIRTTCLAVLFLCSGCSGSAMSKSSIENIISENLKQGSQNQQIIDFFENQNWLYSFDDHRSRYQVRDPEEDKGLGFFVGHQIYIYVDDKKRICQG